MARRCAFALSVPPLAGLFMVARRARAGGSSFRKEVSHYGLRMRMRLPLLHAG